MGVGERRKDGGISLKGSDGEGGISSIAVHVLQQFSHHEGVHLVLPTNKMKKPNVIRAHNATATTNPIV